MQRSNTVVWRTIGPTGLAALCLLGAFPAAPAPAEAQSSRGEAARGVSAVDRPPVRRAGPLIRGTRGGDDGRWRGRDRDRGRYGERGTYRRGDRAGSGRRDRWRPRDRHRAHRDGERARRRGRSRAPAHRPHRDRHRDHAGDRGPRIGVTVGAPPPGRRLIRHRGARFYYHDGFFYRRHGHERGFIVVRPPHGIEVPYLPARSRGVWRKGKRYYHVRGTYYRPIRRSGATFYVSIRL